jgi:hypothetical protein
LLVLGVAENATAKDASIGAFSSASAACGATAKVIAASTSDPRSFVMIEIPPDSIPGIAGKKGKRRRIFL